MNKENMVVPIWNILLGIAPTELILEDKKETDKRKDYTNFTLESDEIGSTR